MNRYLTVVIPTGKFPAQLSACLQAIGRQQLPKNQFEVVVVDDANDSDTAALVTAFGRETGIEARYLPQPRRAGLAAARNRGWRAARGHYIAFTNDDCLPEPGWLLAAAQLFQRGAQVMTGTIRTARPARRPGTLAKPVRLQDTSEFTAANCFCQLSALQRAGGFEESSDLTWRADADFQFKLIDIGVPIVKCTEAVVLRPFRATQRYALLLNERQNRYDALLYKRHPDLFRQRMPHDEWTRIRHYATVVSWLVALVAALAGHIPLLLGAASLYAGLTIWLAYEHWPVNAGSGTWAWPAVQETLITAVATPFLSVFWRLYGSIKYRVLYL